MTITGTITATDNYPGTPNRAQGDLIASVQDANGNETKLSEINIDVDPYELWWTPGSRDFGTKSRQWTNGTSTGLMVWVKVIQYHLSGPLKRADWATTINVSSTTGAPSCPALGPDELALPNEAIRNSCCAQPGAADPVNVVAGNFWDHWTDIAIQGRGPALEWTRAYSSSRAALDGPLGYGWSGNYFMSLTEAAGTVTIVQENGAVIRFAEIGGTWVAPPRVDAELVENGNGTWRLTRRGVEVFDFSSSGRLIAIRDLSGNSVSLAYDGPQLSSVTDASGRTLAIGWTDGRVTSVSAPAAALASGAAHTPIAASFTYDGTGNLETATDTAGGIWTYGYDAHRMTTVREPRHHSLGAAAPVVENHYDASGRVDWQEDRLDRRTTFAYAAGSTIVTNPSGHAVEYEHSGGVTTAIVRDPGPDESRWDFEIDEATLGRTKVTDPNDNITTTTYDHRGRQTSIASGGAITRVAYNAQGLPAIVTDATNVQTNYHYLSGTGRIDYTLRAAPGIGQVTTDYAYGDPVNPDTPTSVTNVRGKTATMAYDANGNMVSGTDPQGGITTWTYNSLGWPLSTVSPNGNIAGGTPANYQRSWEYNARGEVMKETNELGATTDFVRDESGVVIARHDPTVSGTEVTSFDVNAARELTATTGADLPTRSTEYWPDGQMKFQRDGALSATSFVYDDQGRLVTTSDPIGRTTTYLYDAGGRVVAEQEPGGNCAATPKAGCTSYGYSVAGDLTSVDYSDPATADVAFTYDALHRRTSMTDGSGTSTWTWDTLSRLTSFTDPVNGTTSYGYTDHGADPTTTTYPGGKEVRRTFDNSGRLSTTRGWVSGSGATYGYDANSNQTTVDTTASSSIEDTYGFDRANRMNALSIRQGASVVASVSNGRDPEGLVTEQTASGIPGATDAFGYDRADQLASSSAGSYTYDSAGNLAAFADGRRLKFNAANELCYTSTSNGASCSAPPSGATRYTYDGRGNRTAIRPANQTPTTLTYNQADQLTTASVPAFPQGTTQYHDMSSSPVWLAAGETVTSGATRTYQITGANGIPSSGVESVILRLHSVSATAWGTVTAYPTGEAAGSAVGMYFNPDEAASNLTVSKLSAGGQVTVAVSIPATKSVGFSVELVGWYGTASAPGGLTFKPVTAFRAMEQAVAAGSTTEIPIANVNGIPQTGVAAVAVVAHSITSSPTGYFTLYGSATRPGSVSSLYDAGYNSALTVVPLTASGSIKLYSTAATTAAIDVVGYYTSVETGDGYAAHTITPNHLVDTAAHTGECNGGTCNRIAANTSTSIKVVGTQHIPTSAVGAVAVVLHVVQPDGPGWLKAYATGTAAPSVGPLIHDGAFTSATAIVPLGSDGTITIESSVGTDLLVQAVGYFEATTKAYTYAYAGDGLRTSKTAPDGTVTRFTWDRLYSLPLLAAETIDAPGTANDKTIRYIYGPTGHVSTDITTPATGPETYRFYHRDQLGSTVALTSSSGAVVATYSYTPHGVRRTTTGTEGTSIEWAGEYRDEETGFVYLRARYYDPGTGQFLTRDPLEAVTRSAYGYADNNPINVTDPTGLWPGEGLLRNFVDDFKCGWEQLGSSAGLADFGALGSLLSGRLAAALVVLSPVIPVLLPVAGGLFIASTGFSMIELGGGLASSESAHVKSGFVGTTLGLLSIAAWGSVGSPLVGASQEAKDLALAFGGISRQILLEVANHVGF